MIMPDLYIHIGLHKTGTTSIQRAMFANRKLLQKEKSIHYPDFAPNHGKVIYSLFTRDPLKYGVNLKSGHDSEEKIRQHNARMQQKIENGLRDQKCRKVVFSGETISALGRNGIGKLKAFLEPFASNPKIIVYVRDPIGFATSRLQQSIKGKHTLDEFEELPPMPLYRERIIPFMDSFGRENVIIRSFNEAIRKPEGLVGDFLEAIGEEPEYQSKLKQFHSNTSLSLEAVLMLNHAQKERPKVVDGAFSEQRGSRESSLFRSIPGTKFALSRSMCERVLKESDEDLQWLREQMGRDPFGELKLPAGDEVKPEWSEETIRHISLKMLDLYVKARKLKARLSLEMARNAAKQGNTRRANKLAKAALKSDRANEEAKKFLDRLESGPEKKAREGKRRKQKGSKSEETRKEEVPETQEVSGLPWKFRLVQGLVRRMSSPGQYEKFLSSPNEFFLDSRKRLTRFVGRLLLVRSSNSRA